MLRRIGPLAVYGLRLIELTRSPGNKSGPVFGRYVVPGSILLFEQPLSPWRWAGRPRKSLVQRLERAGAQVTRLTDVCATLVDWPPEALKKFMLEEVLLHELGHHLLQQHKGKRRVRIARTRDHEAFAARFAARQRQTD
jgi:hypothetical protein